MRRGFDDLWRFRCEERHPLDALKLAHASLVANLERFESEADKREAVIEWSMEKSGLSHERLDQYYGEVFNRLNQHHLNGLFRFWTTRAA